jgi:CrcB protein
VTSVLLVFLGAGLGGALRHGLNLAFARAGLTAFPWSTFTINVAGSFAMGLLAGYLALRAGAGGEAGRLFLATGVLGGSTTFSAFSLDAVLLYERGAPGLALAYVGGSVALSLLSHCAGLALVRGQG